MSFFEQSADGDLKLTGGRLTIVQDQARQVAQKLTNRFRFFQGEWFKDTRQGFPWFTILGAKPNAAIARALFRKLVLGTPGVAEILDAKVSFDKRKILYTIKARTDTGVVLEGGNGAPFIVV